MPPEEMLARIMISCVAIGAASRTTGGLEQVVEHLGKIAEAIVEQNGDDLLGKSIKYAKNNNIR